MWCTPPRPRLLWLILPLLPAAVSLQAHGEGPPREGSIVDAATTPMASEAHGTPLRSLTRVIRHFDFEEAQTARVRFPLHFKRTIAEDRGFPRFGELALANDAAFSGDWSFRFDLVGGSLSAGIPTGVMPVLPLADYAVSTKVRTHGLRYAGARLIAWLCDAAGDPIPGSLAESALVRTEDAWETLAVEIRGEYPHAADLLFELQVLQPEQMNRSGANPARPMLQDTSGHAWFDDVTVRHVPRIELSAVAACNLITLPQRPALSVLVRDVTNEPLTAKLRIRDLDGRTVHEESFPAPRGRQPAIRELPLNTCGWYRAELEVTSDRRLVGRQRLDFAILPEESGPGGWPAAMLGVILPLTSPARLAVMPELVRRLHAGAAVMAVWDETAEDDSEQSAQARLAALRTTIEEMLDRDLDVTFALDEVPPRLAAAAGLDPSQVLELLRLDGHLWRPALDEMLINFGLRVRRWQLGPPDGSADFGSPDLQQSIDDATAALAPFVPKPIIVVPSQAEQQVPPGSALGAMHVTVAHEVAPVALEEYAAPWLEEAHDVHVTFQPAPPDLYSPRQQVIDLLLRTLSGWRIGLPRMSIPAPWQWPQRPGAQPEPQPAFAAWRGLADALHGRRFAGEMPLADGIHCWLMEGDGPATDALVAWCDQRPGESPTIARLVLADHDVRLRDPFGNQRIIPLSRGEHDIPITDMPIFIEDINLQLAQFRAGFQIAPSFIPAMHRVHEHELVLHNPWDTAVSGSIHLRRSPDCRITPRRQEFVIRSGETIRLPLNIIFDRSIIAGTKLVQADVDLTADRDYRLQLHTDVQVGWKNIEMTAIWQVVENARTGQRDLIITQYVTNRGDRAVSLDTFLRAPGVGQNRRVISSLEPDTTAAKTFNIPDGAALLAGRSVRLGVADRDGVAQLNHQLEIPDLVGEIEPVRQTDASPRP